MIASLTGTLRFKSPTEVLIDVNGVGYSALIPLSTFEKLGPLNSSVVLLTHLHVREDALQLFGFATEDERNLFRLLISVSGIGPKIAQGILSGISASDLRRHIVTGNSAALTAIPNVGKKTAERLVVELRDKIAKSEFRESALPPGDKREGARTEALLALTSLGYNRQSADKAIRAALEESDGAGVSVEELIKKALRHVSAK
ncbi:MAG: Holliday junction branch migration protein RuvA [Ignavibacteriales bacterium]|nr:Holliday junction branch migration protein RuvA [Ignavibacteriales bacterium]